MPEISDAELATLRNADALLRKLDADPRTKPGLEAAIKIHHPEVVTEAEKAEQLAKPFMEKVEGVAESLKARLDKLDERDAAAVTAQTESRITDAFARLRKDGFTDDGIEKIKTLMVDRNIADPEAAAALFEKQNPPVQEESSFSPSAWEVGSTAPGTDLASFFKDEDKAADLMAAQVLNEIRVGKAA